MSGGGWRDVVDPGGFFSGTPKDRLMTSFDPGGAVQGLFGHEPANADSLANRYGLGDPLNVGGNGGLNTEGQTPFLKNQEAAAQDAASRNAPLPALNLPRTNGGLGQYQPRPAVMPHLLPQQQSRSGNMPYLRNRAFGQVLAPLQQQNWGLPQVNPAFLTGINQVSGGQIPNGQINLPPPRGGLQYQVPDPSQPMRKWM